MSVTEHRSLPACPNNPQLRQYIAYPSTVFVFVIIALSSLLFAIFVGFKYNSVRIFNRKIRRENISNTAWILYYMIVAFRAALLSVEFSWNGENEAERIISVLALVLHGGVVLMLEFALNHQLRYRSNSILDKDTKVVNEAAPLLTKPTTCRDLFLTWETLFLFLFVIYIVVLFLHIFIPNKNLIETFWITYFVVYWIQRLPILVLVIIILIQKEGPIVLSKVFLAVGSVLYLCNDLPLTLWTHAFHVTGCLLTIASLVDVVHFLYLLGQLCFFLFLRSEYFRNMEECIWQTVSEGRSYQADFDFRRFN